MGDSSQLRYRTTDASLRIGRPSIVLFFFSFFVVKRRGNILQVKAPM